MPYFRNAPFACQHTSVQCTGHGEEHGGEPPKWRTPKQAVPQWLSGIRKSGHTSWTKQRSTVRKFGFYQKRFWKLEPFYMVEVHGILNHVSPPPQEAHWGCNWSQWLCTTTKRHLQAISSIHQMNRIWYRHVNGSARTDRHMNGFAQWTIKRLLIL